MRTTLGAFAIIVGLSVSASAQSVFHVDFTDGERFQGPGVKPATKPYATGLPFAFGIIPSHPLSSDVTPTVPEFRIRTWLEGEGVRVLLFAVTQKAAFLPSDDDREVQIASVLVPTGQSVVIDATEKYNARPVTVRARPVVRRE
jgi:hypothetical protein